LGTLIIIIGDNFDKPTGNHLGKGQQEDPRIDVS
jgi:hypothetical protein